MRLAWAIVLLCMITSTVVTNGSGDLFGFKHLPKWAKKHITGRQTKLQHDHKGDRGKGGMGRKRHLRRRHHNKASKHHVRFEA
jgi:hypothetical protein